MCVCEGGRGRAVFSVDLLQSSILFAAQSDSRSKDSTSLITLIIVSSLLSLPCTPHYLQPPYSSTFSSSSSFSFFLFSSCSYRTHQEEFDFVVNIRATMKKREDELIRSGAV